ncbi:MAG: hypothetical protein QME52_07910 [Bacteroidota bacterium]|nr:hypothetical protein [Bacteroidota bacterium]
MKTSLFIVALICALPFFLQAQSKRPIGLELPYGEPIPVAVDELGKVTEKLGLTEKQISERVTAALNGQGIHTTKTNKGYYLSIDVELNEKSYGIVLKFRRIESFSVGTKTYEHYTTSWIVYSIGTHNGSVAPIFSSLNEHIGYFLKGFKMANPDY